MHCCRHDCHLLIKEGDSEAILALMTHKIGFAFIFDMHGCGMMNRLVGILKGIQCLQVNSHHQCMLASS